MNGIDYLERGHDRAPHAPCLVDSATGERYTYAEARAATQQIAGALRVKGFSTDLRAAVLSRNSARGVLAFLGILRAGLAAIPVNARASGADIRDTLDRFGCDVLFFHEDFAGLVKESLADLPIRLFVSLYKSGNTVSLDDWISSSPIAFDDLVHDSERTYQILPTGGTTGRPRGVIVPNRMVENHVANCLALMPVDNAPVFLAAAPVTHAAGYLVQTTLSQGGLVVLTPGGSAADIMKLLAEWRVTQTFLPPTLIYDLIALPGSFQYDVSSLRYLIYGGAPMAPAKIKQAIELFGPVLCQIYGQSETSFPNTFLSPRDHVAALDGKNDRLASCGRAAPLCRVTVLIGGRDAAPGEIGELAVKGAGLSPGYVGDDETAMERTPDGWQLTGDIGYRDDENYFFIVDRKKDMIITGGFNVYSVEVENTLLSHPDVLECAVFGIPDSRWGEKVIAEVVIAPGTAFNEEALKAFCKIKLGPVKTPKNIFARTSLPRSAPGKILKNTIRQRYWSGMTRQVN